MRYTVTTIKDATPFKADGPTLVTLGKREGEASFVEFFFGELGQMWWGLVPPLHVLNYYLAHGSCGLPDKTQAGIQHSYEWVPLKVTPDEYRQIVEEVRGLSNSPFTEVEPPSDVRTVPDYDHWAFKRWMTIQHEAYQKRKAET